MPKSAPVRFKPDVIKTIDVTAPATLLQFVEQSLPEMKRTRLKQMLAHDQIAVNDMPQRQFDQPLNPGDKVRLFFDDKQRVVMAALDG